MPLVWEFTRVLRSNVLRRLDSHLFDFRKQPEFRVYFETLLSNPTLHYEQMVGELEAIYLGGGPDAKIAFDTARQLVDCIQILLLEDQQKTLPLFAEKVKDYSGLKVLLAAQPWLDVFSLNHDVNMEELCKFHGTPCRDGFFDDEPQRYSRIARFKTLTKAQMDAGTLNLFGPDGEGINLLKLHGSLDMFAVEDMQLYLKVAPPANAPLGAHVVEIYRVEAHSHKVCASIETRGVGELFVNDVNGGLQFFRRSLLSGAHKFKGRFEQIAPVALFREFQRRLTMVTELDVIGYGFGDPHVNDELAKWMASPGVSMNIYDPKRTHVPAALAAADDRVKIHAMGLTGYCENLKHSGDSFFLRKRKEFLERARERLRQKRLSA
jgi:hypothetical protein